MAKYHNVAIARDPRNERWEVCILDLGHPPTLRGAVLQRFARWADAKRYARQHAQDFYYGVAVYDRDLRVLDTGDGWIDEHGAAVAAPDYAAE